jgi:glyoxylase I family protein
MIKAIAHICISTTDLEKTEKFYCCLGLSKKFNFIREGKVFGYYLQINASNFIEIFEADRISSEKEPQVKHFCLEVDDIDKTIEEIRNRGVSITDKKMGDDNSFQAWLTDPNGIKIELHQYTDKSSQVAGSDCVIK